MADDQRARKRAYNRTYYQRHAAWLDACHAARRHGEPLPARDEPLRWTRHRQPGETVEDRMRAFWATQPGGDPYTHVPRGAPC